MRFIPQARIPTLPAVCVAILVADFLLPHTQVLAQDPAKSSMAKRFDQETWLAWKPGSGPGQPGNDVGTLATAVKLLPLLESGNEDDRALAVVAIRAMIDQQYNVPGLPHHGTWRKSIDENPPKESRQWIDFDPNWREFIGATLIGVLESHEQHLPEDLVEQIEDSLELVAEGALARELPPDYSNIAINHAYFFAALGKRMDRDDWSDYGRQFALNTYALFRKHDCFDEFNAVTYYGIDLEGLSKWIEHPPEPIFEVLGRDIERRMWLQIAQFYHADLRNLCVPFDRAREPNLLKNTHGRSLGSFVNGVEGPEEKPFRNGPASQNFVQRIPEEAKKHLRAFQCERLVRWQITSDPDRVAAAWLGKNVMIGGQDSGYAKLIRNQYHMATIHWKLPDGGTGVITLAPTFPTDAVAEPGKLSTSTYVWPGSGTDDISFRWKIEAPGLDIEMIEENAWRLPGLTLNVDTNTRNPKVRSTKDGLGVSFSGNNRDAGTKLTFELEVVH